MKYVGWIIFFLVIIGLGVGGYFLIQDMDSSIFTFKEVDEIGFDDYDINDFVKQDIICKNNECTYKNIKLTYTISDVKKLGKQKVDVKIEYKNEEYHKTYEINVVDNKDPEIELTDKYVFIDKKSKFDPKSYIKNVTDNYDTLNIEDIEIENPVDTKKIGEYEVKYSIKDTSKNEGIAKLKVIVKDKNAPIDIPKEDIPKVVEEKEKNFIWNYDISGIYNVSKNLDKNNSVSNTFKEIEIGFEETMKISSKFDGSGVYLIEIWLSQKEGEKGTQILNKSEYSNSYEYVYKFEDIGTYYFTIIVKDKINNIELKENLTLKLKEPLELKDMLVSHHTEGEYEIIECERIGGGDTTYYFVAIITNTNDPRIAKEDLPYIEEDIIINEGDIAKLKYSDGYYYNIIGTLVDENENVVMLKNITIQK